MHRREAQKLLMDGKKVTHKDYSGYVRISSDGLVLNQDGLIMERNGNPWHILAPTDGYELYEEEKTCVLHRICKTCKWWVGREIGRCRNKSPNAIDSDDKWPRTLEDDFCGEWQGKDG